MAMETLKLCSTFALKRNFAGGARRSRLAQPSAPPHSIQTSLLLELYNDPLPQPSAKDRQRLLERIREAAAEFPNESPARPLSVLESEEDERQWAKQAAGRILRRRQSNLG
jgi:hypothetical protein